MPGFKRNIRPSHQRRSRPRNPLLHLLAPPRSADQQRQRRSLPFAQYSDVLFLEYPKLCGRAKQQVSGLKHMLALNIENPNTWSSVLKALMNKNGGKTDIPLWPGEEFSMETPEGEGGVGHAEWGASGLDDDPAQKSIWVEKCCGGMVLCFSLVSKCAADHLSILEGQDLSQKGMTKQDTDQPYASLLFYLGYAPNEIHCEPTDSCCCPKV